jgi:STE24 endopeptidase
MPFEAPISLQQFFTPADLVRGASWSFESAWIEILSLVLNVLLLLLATFSRPGRALWLRCEQLGTRGQRGPLDRVLGPQWRTGALFLAAVTVARCGLLLPIDLWHGFHRAHEVGLSHETFGQFLAHLILSWVVAIAANAMLGATLGAIRSRWPRRWWLALGGAAAITLVGDAILEPLWAHAQYQVKPLAEGPLRERLLSFLDTHRADVGDIVVLDASKYGTQANALVTGFGPTKRLVLTDTLLAYGDEAVVGAVAHEVGHRRGERMPLRLALAALSLIVFLYAVEWSLRHTLRAGAFAEAHAYPIVRALTLVLLFAVQPLHAASNRAEEREADELELATRTDYDAYISEQVKLARSNASDPWPPGWMRLLRTHPTASERIARALWYKARVTSRNP